MDEGVCEIDLWTRLENTGALRPEVLVAEVAKVSSSDIEVVGLERVELFCEEDGTLTKPLA